MNSESLLPPGYLLRAFDRVESTNDEARRLAEQGAAAGVVVVADQQLKGILGYTEVPNFSGDFNHDARSSVFAIDQTKVLDGTLVRVMSWYDNEWGFSNRMVDTAVAMGKLI